MLSLALGMVLYLLVSPRPIIRLMTACVLVIPPLVMASLAVQSFVDVDPRFSKFAVFAVGLGLLSLAFRTFDMLAILLALWIVLEVSAFIALGEWPSLSQYHDDGNIFLFPIAAILAYAAGKLHAKRIMPAET